MSAALRSSRPARHREATHSAATAMAPEAPIRHGPENAFWVPDWPQLDRPLIELHGFACNDSSCVLNPREMSPLEPIEWPDEIELLVDRLESESAERALSREERAVMDVYETVPVLESEDCLHDFWQSGVDHQRIINSFDLIGAATLVDPLNASRWCQTKSQDRNDYSGTEADYLATIEEELPDGMDELTDLILEFIEEELG